MDSITFCDNQDCKDSMTCERFCLNLDKFWYLSQTFDKDLNGRCEYYISSENVVANKE